MRFSVLFFIAIMATVGANLGYLLGQSFAWIPLVLGVALLLWWTLRRRPQIMMVVLARVNVAILLLTSLFLSTQVWSLLESGSARLSAGHLLPLFVGVVLLYLYSIYIAHETRTHEEGAHLIEPVARPLQGPPLATTLCIALVLTAYILLLMHTVYVDLGVGAAVSERFLERGIIPPITLLMFFWAVLLLSGKWGGGWYLRYIVSGGAADSPAASAIHKNMATIRSRPKEIEDHLRMLWQRSSESYLFPRYINWAVPILGFIGTVLGISLAADGIRRIISSTDGLSKLSGDLGQAIAPLGIAFDTTLIALSLSVVLTLIQTLVQRSEERLLAGIESQLRGTKSA